MSGMMHKDHFFTSRTKFRCGVLFATMIIRLNVPCPTVVVMKVFRILLSMKYNHDLDVNVHNVTRLGVGQALRKKGVGYVEMVNGSCLYLSFPDYRLLSH